MSVEDIETVFGLAPIAGERRTATATLDLGHGRIEQRGLQTSDVLAGYSDWPGPGTIVAALRARALALAPTSYPHALGKRVCTSG